LLQLAPNQAARERYTLRRAALLDHMGQRREAAEALEEARQSAPTSLAILRAQRALLERDGDRSGVAAHLERACDSLRAAIELAPGELDHWLGLCEMLKAREREDGLQLLAAAAHALGLEHPQLKRLAPRGLGQDALRPAVVERLTPRGQLEALRALFSELGSELEPFLPFDESEQPAQLELAPRVVDGVSALFSLPTLRLVQCSKPLCLPLSAAPLTVCVGGELFQQANDAERFFLLTRAVAVAGFDWSLLVRSAPERVGLVLNALRQAVEPAHTMAVLDAREEARVARELAQRIAPEARPRVQSLLHKLIEHEELSPRRLSAAALDFGSRVALTVTGNMPAALSALLRMRGKPPESYELTEKLELCSTEPAIRGLLSFAISETYMDARQQAWTAAAQEAG
jgi:tetratricopeptide (TPR) repeat protein